MPDPRPIVGCLSYVQLSSASTKCSTPELRPIRLSRAFFNRTGRRPQVHTATSTHYLNESHRNVRYALKRLWSPGKFEFAMFVQVWRDAGLAVRGLDQRCGPHVALACGDPRRASDGVLQVLTICKASLELVDLQAGTWIYFSSSLVSGCL
jgi:hypothetical protein